MENERSKNLTFERVTCPLCGPHDSTVWLGSNGPACYRRCIGCGTIYASPRSIAQIRHAWITECFGVGESAIQNAHSRLPVLRMEANRIQSMVSGGRVLDVGCDLGDFLSLFPVDRWERYGVELSPSAADFAETHVQAKVFAGLLEAAKFADNSFEVITLIDVVFYLDDPAADFAEVCRILKPGGVFVIETTGQVYQLARSKGVISWLVDRKWSRIQPEGAYTFWFPPLVLGRLVEMSGFRVIGYEVMPGAPQKNRLLRLVTNCYLSIVKKLVALSPSALTLAPKYLLYATPRSISNDSIIRRAGVGDIEKIVDLHCNIIRRDNPSRRERRILSIYYSELIRRTDCSIYVADCAGIVIGYSSLISNHRQLLSVSAFLHPIEYFLYALGSLVKPRSWRIIFMRISQELFSKKWPKGAPSIGLHSELRSIAVDPDHRGSGLAFRMLDASLKQLQRNGGERCIAWVAAGNLPSLRLFEKAGFNNLTTRKNGKSEIHILQWMNLKDRC